MSNTAVEMGVVMAAITMIILMNYMLEFISASHLIISMFKHNNKRK